MATWDSADLLARCKRESGVPTTTEFPADSDWYAWLTEAQAHWYNTFAAQVPWVLMGAPTLLTSSDSGETYPFASSIMPLAVELYDAKDGRLLRPGAYWDTTADYVWEGIRIRFPKGELKTFNSGPYARYITPPSAVSASTEPTLVPAHARLLLVYRACALWADRGGIRDPAPYLRHERLVWFGDPAAGDVGVLGALKMQNPFLGAGAYQTGESGGLLEGVSTGAGYQAL